MSKRMLGLTLVLFAVACKDEPDPNLVRVSGHVEATDVRVAPEVGGRIVNLAVKEGDRVEVGTLVLRLDPRDAQLAIERARADQHAAEAQLELLQAGSRPEDIRQSDAQAQAARDEAQAARAELAASETDLQRFEALLESNAGSRKQRDDARTRRDVARERVQASDSRLRAAEQGTQKLRAGARPQEIDAARARLASAAAQVATAEELLKDSEVTSPARGIVSEKLAEAGEVIAPRSPVLVITDLDNAWADVYVPEPVIPRLRMGQAAKIFTDAGGSGLQGSVTYISPKAEFTPRNVQTAEERSKLVYRVRISIDNKEGVLKAGMPIEAEIPLTPVS
jgi:HlyD family secretion protein